MAGPALQNELKPDARFAGPRPSAMPFVVATALLALATGFLFSLYATVHWPLKMTEAGLRKEIDFLIIDSHDKSSGIQIPADRLARLHRASRDLGKDSSSLPEWLGLYTWTGILAFLCSIVAMLREPRWFSGVALLLGIAALGMAFTTM